jgi:tRNA-dihydrouridine synthase A
MMDWTDRHCRFFHRLLSRHARLYTEMVTTGALLHGERAAAFALQRRGAPGGAATGRQRARRTWRALRRGWASSWGYDEINLELRLPSERVQRGAFGACLMSTSRHWWPTA